MKDLGQLFIVGFYGTDYNDELEELLEKYRVGGIILFKRNISEDRRALKKLISRIYEKAAEIHLPKPFITIDHEGGRVHRLGELATHFPPPGLLSPLSLTDLEHVYAQQAKELKYFGFNTILGPVLDLCPATGTQSHIGPRAFGQDPPEVIERSIIAIRALEHIGIITVPKHFPGYGDAEIDPHLNLPSNNRPLYDLKDNYLAPFQAAIDHGVSMIMTAHILNMEVDPKLPVTLSETWLDYLKDEMGFHGLVLSDDLCMKSIWDAYPPEQYAETGLQAGLDILLVCHTKDEFEGSFSRSYDYLQDCVDAEREWRELVSKKLERIHKLKKKQHDFTPLSNDAVFEEGRRLLQRLERKYSLEPAR